MISTWTLFALSAHAMAPTCIVSWEALHAGGRTSPAGGGVDASSALAVVDDGETVRPLVGLPLACELGADAPRGQVVGDRVVAFDAAASAVTWHALSGGTWSEVDRFDGPLPREGLPDFGVGFVAGEDRFAIVSRDGAVRHVDVLRRDGAGWVDDDTFQIDEDLRWGSWIAADHLRVAAGPFTVRHHTGGTWTTVAPAPPPPYADHWVRDPSAFDGATLLTNLGDPSYETGRIAVYRWDGAGWTWEAVFEQYPDLGVFAGYQGDIVVSGNVAAAMWVRVPHLDTGAPTIGHQAEVHLWRRGMAGWSLVDTFVSPRHGDDLGHLALHGHTLLAGAGSAGIERPDAPGAAYGAVYVFDVPVVDADGDGEDERTDPDDLDPNVQSGTSETGDTGQTAADSGAPYTPPTETGDSGHTLTDGAAETGTGDKDGGCGCGGGGGGSVAAVLAAAAIARRRRRSPE